MDMEKIIKCLRLTASDQDGEALAAIRMANRLIKASGKDWDKVIAQPQQTAGGFSLEDVNRAARLLFDKWKTDYMRANAPKPVYSPPPVTRRPEPKKEDPNSYCGFKRSEKGNWFNWAKKATAFKKYDHKTREDVWAWVCNDEFSSDTFSDAFEAIDDFIDQNE